jgi:hypothetical protein
MKRLFVFFFVLSIALVGCTTKYTLAPEDKMLLENAMNAAKAAENSADKASSEALRSEKNADRAERAADRAESAADRAERAAANAGSAADKAVRAFEMSQKK